MSTTAVPSCGRTREQPELGVEIGLDRRVVVEVVAAEIGEARRLDADAVEAALVEAVARASSAAWVTPSRAKPVEHRVQRHRVGRGQAAVVGSTAG